MITFGTFRVVALMRPLSLSSLRGDTKVMKSFIRFLSREMNIMHDDLWRSEISGHTAVAAHADSPTEEKKEDLKPRQDQNPKFG